MYGTEEFIQKKYSIYLPIGTVAEFTVHADIDTCGGQVKVISRGRGGLVIYTPRAKPEVCIH